jgi:hypothetical protein
MESRRCGRRLTRSSEGNFDSVKYLNYPFWALFVFEGMRENYFKSPSIIEYFLLRIAILFMGTGIRGYRTRM